jgi:hypothetical protein
LETTAVHKKATLDMAANNCVQHKWCLLAKSCGMDNQVQKKVEIKMNNMLEEVKKVEEERALVPVEMDTIGTAVDCSWPFYILADVDYMQQFITSSGHKYPLG